MKEEICWITNNGKTAKSEYENDDSDFIWALYSVNKSRTIRFPYYSLTCLNKDASVLLKIINIWTSL